MTTTMTLGHSLEPRLETSIPSLLAGLTRIPPGPHRIVSCYVRLEPADRTRRRYLLAVKSRIRELGGDPGLAGMPRDARMAVDRDLDRIRDYLEHTRGLPHARGLALFACEALGLWEGAPLPRVHRTRLVLDETPWIAELVASGHEAEPAVVAVLDRAVARFFEVTAWGALELAGGFTTHARGGKYVADRKDAPGRGEREYHARLREERHRHYAAIADRLAELIRERPGCGILLAGPSDHTSALLRFLPEPLARQVIGTARLNPTSVTAAEVQAAEHRTAVAHERRMAAADLLQLQEAIGSGWAVEGARDTLRALSRGQVRTLYVGEEVEGGGFRCGATARLVLARADCRGEGDARAVRDLADEAIEDALRQRARVVVVPSGAGPAPVDGLAATLRFRA